MRVATYNDDKSKKTVVITHGFGMSGALMARLLPGLAKNYRIITFDNLGFGLNSRTDNVGDAFDSADSAERWVASWWD